MLTITPDYVSYQPWDGVPVHWLRSEVVDVRFGRHSTAGNPFVQNTQVYSISFLHLSGREVNVEFSSYLFYKSGYEKLYADIVKDVDEYFLKGLVAERINRLKSGESVEIERLKITTSGISVVGTGLSFTWNELAVERYDGSFLMFKARAPEFKFSVHLNRWNSEIIYGVVTGWLGVMGMR